MTQTHEMPLRAGSAWPIVSADRSSSAFFARKIHPPLTAAATLTMCATPPCAEGALALQVRAGRASPLACGALVLALETSRDRSGSRGVSRRARTYASACDGSAGGQGCAERTGPTLSTGCGMLGQCRALLRRDRRGVGGPRKMGRVERPMMSVACGGENAPARPNRRPVARTARPLHVIRAPAGAGRQAGRQTFEGGTGRNTLRLSGRVHSA